MNVIVPISKNNPVKIVRRKSYKLNDMSFHCQIIKLNLKSIDIAKNQKIKWARSENLPEKLNLLSILKSN